MSKSKGEISVNLRQFHMEMIQGHPIIIAVGGRGTGKSVIVADFLYHKRDFPIGTVISPTDNYNLVFRPHVPFIFIHEKFTPELIEQVVERQKDIADKVANDPSYKDVDPRCFLILDDCLADKKSWINDDNIRFIFMNGRHVKLTYIMTLQYCMGITPEFRTNVDWVFLCSEPKLSNQKRIYEQYAGIFPSFDMFRNVFNQCTDNHGCLVINTSACKRRLEDQVFWYRADMTRPDWNTFKICLPCFWTNNDQYIAQKNKCKRKHAERRLTDDRKPNFVVTKLSEHDESDSM
jgi:hypothetical protein